MTFDFEFRRNTAAGAAANNRVLRPGEPGVETDTHRMKVGDGVTAWNALPYSVLGNARLIFSATQPPDPAPGDPLTNVWIQPGAGAAGSVPDASTSTKGKVQLAGDLSGTAALPTVPALATKADLVSGIVPGAELATGSATGATFLRGDRTWAAGPSGTAAVVPWVDVWDSQASPSGVTDWGPILNTLLSAGNRNLYFAQHDFPFSTQVVIDNLIGVVFRGQSGTVYPTGIAPYSGRSRLIWKGGIGSGTALMVKRGDGCIFEDLAVMYDNTTGYNGDLVSIQRDSSGQQSGHCIVNRCVMGSTVTAGRTITASVTNGSNALTVTSGTLTAADAWTTITGTGVQGYAVIASVTDATHAVLKFPASSTVTGSFTVGVVSHSARTLLKLEDAVSCEVTSSAFYRARTALRGFDGDTNRNPDNVTVERCVFESCIDAYIMNPGRYWDIADCTFEYGLGGYPTASAVDTDFACTSAFVMRDNRHFDFETGVDQRPVRCRAGSRYNASLIRERYEDCAGINVDLQGPGEIIMDGCSFARPYGGSNTTPLVDLGPSTTALKDVVDIRACHWTQAGLSAPPVANMSGHPGARVYVDAGVMYLGNRGVIALPSTNPTGGGYFYTESGALKYKGSAGTVTTIASA